MGWWRGSSNTWTTHWEHEGMGGECKLKIAASPYNEKAIQISSGGRRDRGKFIRVEPQRILPVRHWIDHSACSLPFPLVLPGSIFHDTTSEI